MEKLTIEEKAKAYDNAIERAKNYYSTTDSVADTELIELIFPELKEGEDEKIRKTLISYFGNFHLHTFAGLDPKKILAWLEKQGCQTDNSDDELEAALWGGR